MTEPEWLHQDDVLFMHEQAVRIHGGLPGLKDEHLLQSALHRPRDKASYAEAEAPDLQSLAAAYAFGIASNHPFNDGNKRTAWSSCVLFLKLNGIELDPVGLEAADRIVQLASRASDEAGFATWLRSRSRKA